MNTRKDPRRLLRAADFHRVLSCYWNTITPYRRPWRSSQHGRRIQTLYHWPNMYRDIKNALDHCPVCFHQLRPLYAFQRVSIDFI